MAKKIKNATDLVNSIRFKKITENKSFTNDEMQQLELFVQKMDELGYGVSVYLPVLSEMVKWDMENLVDRFLYLKKNPNARTKEYFYTKYAPNEGQKRWDQYVEKQRYSNTYEYKKEKYNWTEEQFDSYNRNRSITLKNCIKRHGQEKGTEIWNSYLEKQAYTNTLDYYVEKYGEDGRKKWINYNKEKGNSSSITWVMKKHGVSEKEAAKIIADRSPHYVSNIEREFVINLQKELGREVKYTCLTNQFSIWNRYLNSIKFYDIVDTSTMKIVEFYGDYWHCNPNFYKPDFCIKGGLLAKEVWKRDYLKLKSALDNSFDVMIIWETDYISKKEDAIKRAAEWISLPKKK